MHIFGKIKENCLEFFNAKESMDTKVIETLK